MTAVVGQDGILDAILRGIASRRCGCIGETRRSWTTGVCIEARCTLNVAAGAFSASAHRASSRVRPSKQERARPGAPAVRFTSSVEQATGQTMSFSRTCKPWAQFARRPQVRRFRLRGRGGKKADSGRVYCVETGPEGRPLLMGTGTASSGALPKTWSQSSRWVYTLLS